MAPYECPAIKETVAGEVEKNTSCYRNNNRLISLENNVHCSFNALGTQPTHFGAF